MNCYIPTHRGNNSRLDGETTSKGRKTRYGIFTVLSDGGPAVGVYVLVMGREEGGSIVVEGEMYILVHYGQC